ncbi:hypothetical protein HDK64DRAFT_252900 [Phyllosticta capitalensis]
MSDRAAAAVGLWRGCCCQFVSRRSSKVGPSTQHKTFLNYDLVQHAPLPPCTTSLRLATPNQPFVLLRSSLCTVHLTHPSLSLGYLASQPASQRRPTLASSEVAEAREIGKGGGARTRPGWWEDGGGGGGGERRGDYDGDSVGSGILSGIGTWAEAGRAVDCVLLYTMDAWMH